MAAAVNCLVFEPIPYIVSASAGTLSSRFRKPYAFANTSLPFFATPIATDGVALRSMTVAAILSIAAACSGGSAPETAAGAGIVCAETAVTGSKVEVVKADSTAKATLALWKRFMSASTEHSLARFRAPGFGGA